MTRNRNMAVKTLVRIGVMAALGAVLKIYFSPMIGPSLRVNTYGAPLVVMGILYGPLAGAITGYVVDITYSSVLGYGLIPNFFTISTVMWGLIPGLFLYKKTNIQFKRLFLVVLLASFSEVLFNTLGIKFVMNLPIIATLPYRVALALVLVPVQVYIIDIIYDRVVKPELMLTQK